ncbi:hypothetical protein WDU94_004482 [Cyamophila willieti]
MNEELLIECVRKNEFLYKPKHKDHCNQRLAKNCWDNIGTTMGQTGADCKKKWNSLRDRYRRVKNSKNTKSGQGTDDSPKWKFEDQMSFLDNFMKGRRQKLSLPESGEESHLLEQDEVDSEEPITNLLVNSEESSSALSVAQSPTPYAPPQSPLPHYVPSQQVPKRRSYGHQGPSTSQILQEYLAAKKTRAEPEKDSLSKYFDAVESTVRTFKPILQVQIKSKISALVSEFEMMSLSENEGSG